VESLKAQEESLRYQMEATYTTLATNVVSAVIQEASLRSQIAATELLIKQNEEAVQILKKQMEYGYAMAIDLASQESSLAQAQQLLPPMQKQLDQTRDLVRALVGATPDTSLDDNFNLSALHLPEELPLTLPSTLVEQRPDVRAAEEQLHAAVAGVGIAIANRLPQFTINGGMGGNANNLDWLFQTGGPFWSLTGGVMQTLFDGGTLRHRQSAAEEAVIQAEAQYKNTIITAFQNVADTLHAIQSDADSMKACNDAERSARTVQDVTAVQYREGYVNYLTLLQAQEAYQQATVTMIQAQTNRLGDVAALYQALGGGWWNRNNDANQMSRKGD
jgi:NodT family efflux transporter outer membrane factor (OMF) lipoprotein